jgi:hypothetical protein
MVIKQQNTNLFLAHFPSLKVENLADRVIRLSVIILISTAAVAE